MKQNRATSKTSILGAVLLWALVATTQAGSYYQDFNSFSTGTTDPQDGSTVVDNGTGSVGVWENLGNWKALRLTMDTPTGADTVANYALADLDSGDAIESFSATFDVLMKSSGEAADGFSFNFGTLGILPDGGEEGMSGSSMLSIGWDTYDNGGDPNSIEVFVNGSSIANNTTITPIVSPDLDGAFRQVSITLDSNGLDVIYDGSTVFSDLDVSEFSASAGDRFAIAARTGTNYEDVFIDNMSVSTVIPEPATFGLIALFGSAILFIRRTFSI